MKKWRAVFKDGELGSEALDALVGRFDEAVRTGQLDGREIIGLWIVDEAAEQTDLSKVFGGVPSYALARVRAYARTVGLSENEELEQGPLFVTWLKWLILIAVVIGIWLKALFG